MSIVAIIQQLQGYFDPEKEKYNQYTDLLTGAVSNSPYEYYNDPVRLTAELKNRGASDEQVAKIYLMCCVTGFKELLQTSVNTPQNNLERYIHNALLETDLNTQTVLEIAEAIARSLNIPCSVQSVFKAKNNNACFVIPVAFYEKELNLLRHKIDQRSISDLDMDDIQRLETLVKAGIPRAKFYYAEYLLAISENNETVTYALSLLQEASCDGDSMASGALGDYYYNQENASAFSTAYAYYTGYGAASLNSVQRSRVVDILNTKKANDKVLIVTGIFVLLTIVCFILFNTSLIFGIIGAVLEVALAVVAFIRHKVAPYDNIMWASFASILIWVVFTALSHI